MNDSATAAWERLLDAELATVLGRRPAPPARARMPWLQAALVLLGIAVVAVVSALRPSAHAAQEPDPAPMPQAIRVDTLEELKGLPDTVVNLQCKLGHPDQFSLLQRFRQLRRLSFSIPELTRGGRVVVAAHRDWDDTEAEVLAPLAALPGLEELHFSGRFRLRPEHLTVLRTAPRLREVALAGGEMPVDAPLAEALAGLPRLSSLRLIQSPLDAAGARCLLRIPVRSLVLWESKGIDDGALEILAEHPQLARLELHGFGRVPLDPAQSRRWQPSPKAMARLAALPKLRELSFHDCEVGDELLAALPGNLRALSLYSTSGYTADGLRALRRLGDLRSLQFRERFGYLLIDQHLIAPVEAAAALADLLQTLRLNEFRFTGHPTPELMAALAEQPDLHTVEFVGVPESPQPPPPDLAVLARLPALRSVLLHGLEISAEDLRPLRAVRSLRRVVVSCCGDLTTAVVAAELPEVAIEVSTLADWLKK